jgi:hypothetical protein
VTCTFGSQKVFKLGSVIADIVGKSDGFLSFKDFHKDSNQGSKTPSYLANNNNEILVKEMLPRKNIKIMYNL